MALLRRLEFVVSILEEVENLILLVTREGTRRLQ